MPFGLVSGVSRGMGILDGGGDRRRGRGSFGVNLARPIVTNGAFAMRSCRITLRTCYCTYVVDVEINYSLEVYGPGSLCFDHGSPWTVQHCDQTFPVENWGSGCYQVLPFTVHSCHVAV